MLVVGWLVVGYPLSRITALRILPKLGMELEGDELGTVTEPDFPKKFWIIQKSGKRFFADFAILDGFLWKSNGPICH